MSATALPHAYPFRFVDSVLEAPAPAPAGGDETFQGRVKTLLCANGRATLDGVWGSPLLYAEAIAQAALLLEGRDPEAGKRGFLAGIDGFHATRPPEVGETLDISVRLAARFGAMVKFEGEVRSGDDILASGSVLVRKGEEAAADGPGSRGLPEP